MKRSLPKAILVSGIIVGTADILLAFLNAYIQAGTIPDKVLRYIASAVFDKKAFVAADSSMVLWGLLFHFMIAMGFTALFYLIFPKIKWLARNKIITGILYGVFMWAFMFYVVLPFTNTPGTQKFEWKNALLAIGILVVAIGIPLSYFAGKFYGRRI